MSTRRAIEYRIVGMDCADDAARIEKVVRQVAPAEAARVSIGSQTLTLPARLHPERFRAIEAEVAKLGYRLEPTENAETASPTHRLPSYRRALWIVVALNLGFGIVEAIGGYLARSQALKADALDFVGDGLITLLGLVAVRRSAAWRAHTALIQGMFLGVLGLVVLTNAIYRGFVQQMPSSEAMGVLATLALFVNVAAAAVLLPYRTGDANVRAVWLFSRNDAIGNLLVMLAAAMVALTRSPWPDLLVGAAVAMLFLQSSWAIVRSARRDMMEAV